MCQIKDQTTGIIYTMYDVRDVKTNGKKYSLVQCVRSHEEIVSEVNKLFSKQIKQGVQFNIVPSKRADIL